jgi:hypothetical protein
MQAIPVQAYEPAHEQFVAQLDGLVAGADVVEGVAEEEGVAGGAVDGAVEDVCYYFSLAEGGLVIRDGIG